MSQPYVGEIRIFSANFAPVGWMLCQGQLLPISEYETLFNLLGTTYGGDGQSTFALPNLQGRLVVHQGAGFVVGQLHGVESVQLTVSQLAAHSHTPRASSSPGTATAAQGNAWAASSSTLPYAASPSSTLMTPSDSAGGGQPHENMHPFLCLNFIIAVFGIFPSPT